MSSPSKKTEVFKLVKVEYEFTGRLSGLAKSHKIIRTAQIREAQFLKLCAQIQLREFRNERAEKQHRGRLEKRRTKQLNK